MMPPRRVELAIKRRSVMRHKRRDSLLKTECVGSFQRKANLQHHFCAVTANFHAAAVASPWSQQNCATPIANRVQTLFFDDRHAQDFVASWRVAIHRNKGGDGWIVIIGNCALIRHLVNSFERYLPKQAKLLPNSQMPNPYTPPNETPESTPSADEPISEAAKSGCLIFAATSAIVACFIAVMYVVVWIVSC